MSLAIGNLFLVRMQSALARTPHLFRYTRFWVPELPLATSWLPNSTALTVSNRPLLGNLWQECIWHIKRTFQPSLVRRKRKMGWLARKRHRHGRAILRRRKAKGRWRLCGGI